MPDVIEESIFVGAARDKLLAGEDGVVNFAPEAAFELSYGYSKRFSFGISNDEDIDVAALVLLVPRERTIQVGFLDSLNFLEGTRELRSCTDGFPHDAADFLEERIICIELKILLATVDFGPEESFALQAAKLAREIRRVNRQLRCEVAKMLAGGGVREVERQQPLARYRTQR